MAKNRAQKEVLLEQYKKVLNDKAGFIAVDPKGVSTTALTTLKQKLKEIGANLLIVKNNVFKIALDETSKPVAAKDFTEQTAIVTYESDPTVAAKAVKEVQTETEVFATRFAIVDGNYLSAERAMELADIPPREVLLAKLLGSLNSPLVGFANGITGNVRGFVQAVRQMSEKA